MNPSSASCRFGRELSCLSRIGVREFVSARIVWIGPGFEPGASQQDVEMNRPGTAVGIGAAPARGVLWAEKCGQQS
jgi:hypothetical protein